MQELAEVDAGFAELEQLAAGKPAPAVHVRFFIEALEDVEAGKKAGKRIFRDVEMIEKRIPGDKDIVRREVREKDKREFPAHYVAFRKGQNQETASGFPIRQWPQATRGEAETLAASGVYTVEQLAGAPLDMIKHVGPYASLQAKAKDWLKQESGGAELAKLRDENDALTQRVAAMERMIEEQAREIAAARNGHVPQAPAGPDPRIAELEAQMRALADAVKARPRGRPRKQVEET